MDASETGWSEPLRRPSARRGTIDVWRGELGRDRASAMLLDILSRYAACDPDELRIERDAGGKPRMQEPNRGDVRFNMSHSEEVTLVAVSSGREVGIDVERIDRGRGGRIDEVAIARRMLGGEQAGRLREMAEPQRRIEFLRAWTRYEARVKCLGVGIGGTAAAGSAGESEGESEELWIVELDVGKGAIAAVAAQGGEECEVRRWAWRESKRAGAEPNGPSAGQTYPGQTSAGQTPHARAHGPEPSR